MVYRNSSDFRVFAVVLAAAALGLSAAYAGGKAEKIKFSEPSDSGTSSNLTRLSPNAPNSREIEDELLKPFKSINTGNSLDAIFDLSQPLQVPQPNQSRPLSKHALDQIDRRKNWAFTDLNDLTDPSSLDGVLGNRKLGANGLEDDKLSLIDRYYQNGGQKKTDGKTPAKNLYDPLSDKKRALPTDFDPLDSALKHTDPFFKKMMTGDSGERERSVADTGVFSSASVSLTPDAETREQLRRVAMFRHELDPSYPLPKSDSSLNNYADLARQARTPSTATNASIFAHTDISPASGVFDPTSKAFHSHVYDDPTATALGLPQKPMFPVVTPTPPPTAQSIQALIDPFSANAPRRKF